MWIIGAVRKTHQRDKECPLRCDGHLRWGIGKGLSGETSERDLSDEEEAATWGSGA